MSKCLVLGANGFIGSYVVDALVIRGHEVVAFDRFSANRINFDESDRVATVAGDFLNRGDLADALRGIEFVFHFISTTTPITAENDPTIDVTTNVRMSIELLELCVEAGVKRIIYPSTGGAIYGLSASNASGLHKEDDPTLPLSPYAIGKLTVENYLRYFHTKHDLDYITFRVSNPYGSRQSANSRQGVIPIFLERIHERQPITLYGDGSMVRDYIYVKDAADLIVTAFDKPCKHRLYNIGSGRGTTVTEIVTCIEEVTGRRAKVETALAPSTFVDKVILDTSRFTDEFHTVPQTSLKSGIEATYGSMLHRTAGNH